MYDEIRDIYIILISVFLFFFIIGFFIRLSIPYYIKTIKELLSNMLEEQKLIREELKSIKEDIKKENKKEETEKEIIIRESGQDE